MRSDSPVTWAIFVYAGKSIMEPCHSHHVKNIRYNLKFEILFLKALDDELVRGVRSIIDHIHPFLYPRTPKTESWRLVSYEKNCKKSIFDQV